MSLGGKIMEDGMGKDELVQWLAGALVIIGVSRSESEALLSDIGLPTTVGDVALEHETVPKIVELVFASFKYALSKREYQDRHDIMRRRIGAHRLPGEPVVIAEAIGDILRTALLNPEERYRFFLALLGFKNDAVNSRLDHLATGVYAEWANGMIADKAISVKFDWIARRYQVGDDRRVLLFAVQICGVPM